MDRKLTKKQKKGLAFRQGKRKVKEQDDLPEFDPDVEDESNDVAEIGAGKKRKRAEEEEEMGGSREL